MLQATARFRNDSPLHKALENAHIAFDVPSSNFYIKWPNQVRTIGGERWTWRNTMGRKDWPLLLSSISLPAYLQAKHKFKGFLNCIHAFQNLIFLVHIVLSTCKLSMWPSFERQLKISRSVTGCLLGSKVGYLADDLFNKPQVYYLC